MGLLSCDLHKCFWKVLASLTSGLPLSFHGSNILLVCIRTTLFPCSSDPCWPIFFFFFNVLVEVEAGGGRIGRNSLFPAERRLLSNLFTQRAGLAIKEVLGLFHKYSLPLPTARATGESFLHFHSENLTGFLEIKAAKVWGPPKVVAPRL